jgi:hypothetical protein
LGIDKKTETELKRRWCRLTVVGGRIRNKFWDGKERSEAEESALETQLRANDAELAEVAEAYQDAGGELRSIVLLGSMGRRGPDHSDVDAALRARYPSKQVLASSEADGFYAHVTRAIVDDVERFLRATFPALSFKREALPGSELTLPGVGVGLKGAEAWLKKDLAQRKEASAKAPQKRKPAAKDATVQKRGKTAASRNPTAKSMTAGAPRKSATRKPASKTSPARGGGKARRAPATKR